MARDLRDVLDAILAGVVVIDAEGIVEQLNSAACGILEHSAHAAVGDVLKRMFESLPMRETCWARGPPKGPKCLPDLSNTGGPTFTTFSKPRMRPIRRVGFA